MPEPGPLLSARVLNELRNRPWMELRDPASALARIDPPVLSKTDPGILM